MTTATLPETGTRLGKPLRTFTSGRWYHLVPGGFCVLLGLVFLAGGALGGVSLAVLLGLGLAAVGGYQIYKKTEEFGWRVTLHENGLSSRDDRRTARSDICAPVDCTWDEILGVKTQISEYVRGLVTTRFEFYVLRLTHRDEFLLSNALAGVRQLGERVRQEVFKRQFLRAADAFNVGQEVNFGTVRLSQAGLRRGDQLIPLNEVAAVAVHDGEIHVRRAGRNGPAAAIPVADTENGHVLLALLEQVLGPGRVG
jgi:hypothetical protein